LIRGEKGPKKEEVKKVAHKEMRMRERERERCNGNTECCIETQE
jgi:hypothetical protein